MEIKINNNLSVTISNLDEVLTSNFYNTPNTNLIKLLTFCEDASILEKIIVARDEFWLMDGLLSNPNLTLPLVKLVLGKSSDIDEDNFENLCNNNLIDEYILEKCIEKFKKYQETYRTECLNFCLQCLHKNFEKFTLEFRLFIINNLDLFKA